MQLAMYYVCVNCSYTYFIDTYVYANRNMKAAELKLMQK